MWLDGGWRSAEFGGDGTRTARQSCRWLLPTAMSRWGRGVSTARTTPATSPTAPAPVQAPNSDSSTTANLHCSVTRLASQRVTRFDHDMRIPYRTASAFCSTKTRRKKFKTRELAAASGVPPAFCKQCEPCCIFLHSRKCRRRAGGIAVRCVVSCYRILTQWLKRRVIQNAKVGKREIDINRLECI